ncbi:Peptidoglycan-binding domain 1 [Candidatus Koribacter versatilis Ellin345]|uniref:Peptidoglycan-binding domain 1 n=2 Tax=Candidatus Korobacter versatilis TaxID=658062 RepID=Q1IV89_KORVE|nr:Peptidoglycan-binding domain 1 [Candidatus Koribacter versatilis Ellin345]
MSRDSRSIISHVLGTAQHARARTSKANIVYVDCLLATDSQRKLAAKRTDDTAMMNLGFARCAFVRGCTFGLCVVGILATSACATGKALLPGGETFQAATSGPTVADSSLREIVAAGQLSDLRWPDFSDYRAYVQTFYESSGYNLAWTRGGQTTPQALAIIEILKQADGKGLNAEDYDASRWADRTKQLSQPAAAARFDTALTVCVMRYISDLHIGRVNPTHVKFALTGRSAKYDLPQFLTQRLVNGQNVEAELAAVQPQFAGYKATQAWLQRYIELARQDNGEQLPVPTKALDPGKPYAGIPRLTSLLHLLGDLPADAVVPAGDVYQAPLVDAVKRYQSRHGLTADGRLGAQTVKELNTPLSTRVEQLRLTLERWRWLPQEFPQPPVVVNIPEFRLRAYDANHKVVLSMNVVVGKALRHETPVFDDEMKYVVFRPYWNVPPSIQRSEIVPAIQRDRDYISKKNYEVTTQAGQVVTSGTISDEVLQQLRAGKLAVRQKPGPTNALGLVKLIFPNQYNVYLHSTPSQQLFSQARRDFSHGCIRVEKPAELSAWALQDKPEWTVERVRAAMQKGPDNVQVNLSKPVPVLILYGTAVAEEDGSVHFFDDLYGYDADLEKALARGYPYPL